MSNSRTIKIEGMHCGSCVKKTSEALKRVAGVLDAVVSLEEHNAKLTLAYDVDDEKLDKLLRAAGDYRIAGNDSADTDHTVHEKPESLYPLILIASYIAGAICLIAWTAKDWSPGAMMRHFMASFFLVFSFFKLLDLRGFVDAYRSYDLLAKAIPGWAMVYPFVELQLGIAYWVAFSPIVTNVITLVIMLVGAVGVLKAILDKRTIRCACLGTALNLPMTKITLIEDLSMAAMAAAMLLIR